MTESRGWSRNIFSYAPGGNTLQTVEVFSRDSLNPSSGYWLVYIHGGAWWDPTVTSSSLYPAATILSTSAVAPSIASFASINYRLSRHPNFQQELDDPHTSRDAVHPDHINDIRKAIHELQALYKFGSRYILVGHSCGATLAFQSVMSNTGQMGGKHAVEQPDVIVGVEGIYDLRLLRDTFSQYEIYQQFISTAFGTDEQIWDAVSPVKITSADGVAESWRCGKIAILAHSKNDSLVDVSQHEAMACILESWASTQTRAHERRVKVMTDLKGEHDKVWKCGKELATVIEKTIEELNQFHA